MVREHRRGAKQGTGHAIDSFTGAGGGFDPDGGPGMADTLNLLRGSDDPGTDQRMFIKSQIVFWLLGATDGHAKNFSIFLKSGGRFWMTPLYDVMSAQPSVDAGRLRENRFKLALAVGGNRHYVVNTILPRHFAQTATREGIPCPVIDEICRELAEEAEPAIEKVLQSLPQEFPTELANSVVNGIRRRLRPIEHALA